MKRIILAALVGVLVSGAAAPALADHCPMDMKRILVALENVKASDNSVKKVRSLITLGLVSHENGYHDIALKVLHGAMEMLGISHK